MLFGLIKFEILVQTVLTQIHHILEVVGVMIIHLIAIRVDMGLGAIAMFPHRTVQIITTFGQVMILAAILIHVCVARKNVVLALQGINHQVV